MFKISLMTLWKSATFIIKISYLHCRIKKLVAALGGGQVEMPPPPEKANSI